MVAPLLLAVVSVIAFYILIGYPVLLLYFFRRAAPAVRKDMQFRSTVSVLMAVRNGEQFVQKKLESLLGLRYPAELMEILVVSDGSTDRTNAIVESFAGRGVRLLLAPAGGKPAALNLALCHASGDILFYTDIRQVVHPDSLLHMVANFADPTVGAVTGEPRFLNPDRTGEEADMDIYWRYELWVRRRHSEIHSACNTTGWIYTLRRGLAESIPGDTLADDLVIPLKASFRGYRVIVEPQAVAFDYPKIQGGEFRRKLRTLGGLWQVHVRLPELFTRKYRMRIHFFSHKTARLVLPWAILLSFVTAAWLPSIGIRRFLLLASLLLPALALIDYWLPKRSPLKRFSSPARSFLAMNLASLLSVTVFFIRANRLWRPTQVTVSEPDLGRQPVATYGGSAMAVHAPLRVCMLLDTVKEDAGTEKLVAAFATQLDRERCEPHVCCFEDSERLAGLSRHVRTAVFPLGRVYSPAGLRRIWQFRRYVQRNQIDVVHSFMKRADIVGVLAVLGLQRVAVITSRLNTGYWYTPAYKLLFRILDHFTTRVVTNSAYAKSVVAEAERLPLDKITVLYTGVDLARYSFSSGNASAAAALGIPSDSQVVGVVANYRPVKDLPLFLRAAQIVAAEVPRTVFLLVGKGGLKPGLEKLAAALGIAERVYYSGGQGAVPDYLARMSVGCLSSLSEGLPNSILEYMAAGLPVVATDVGGNSELVADGITGYLVRSRTPEALAAPIVRLLRDGALRAAMGQKGLERARTEFDLSAAVRRLEDFYISLVENARDRPVS